MCGKKDSFIFECFKGNEKKKIFNLKRINSIHGLEKEEVGKEGKE